MTAVVEDPMPTCTGCGRSDVWTRHGTVCISSRWLDGRYQPECWDCEEHRARTSKRLTGQKAERTK